MSEEKFITQEYVKKLLPKRKGNSHKGTYGNILNIAGSENYHGAAFLSTVSALKAGCGYVVLASIKEVLASVSILCPEAVFIPLESKNGTISKEEYKKIIEIFLSSKVLEFGCGISSLLGNQEEIEGFIQNLLNEICTYDKPVIIDADGLNIISKLNITQLPKDCIMTPHPQELSRLIGVDVSEIQLDRTKYAKIAAKKYSSIVVLKGHHSVITNGYEVLVNPTGNSSLSKAGSGDVLTGLISGFCAQGVNTFEAAILGVYVHGLAGEIASTELTQYGVNASDLINYIPKAIKSLDISNMS